MERVRFAPSPTGPLHIGGLRTALFNYLYTKKNNGAFIVRIEDTDQTRKVEGSEGYIFEALEWCGIAPDESPLHEGEYGPYRQSERKDIYQKYIRRLVDAGKAYFAFDHSDDLDRAREEAKLNGVTFKYNASNRGTFKNSLSCTAEETSNLRKRSGVVVRLKVDIHREVKTTDVLRGTVTVNASELEDKILMKADGMPTYHFANVVDDHLMKISTVIRGEEWLPSLPIHQLLYEAFGWEAPQFLHLPLILNPGGKGKLSKRDGDKHGYPVFPLQWGATQGYKEIGFLPEAHLNYIAQLGWSMGENELMRLDEMIAAFNVKQLQKGGARFDYDKARWINQQYLSAMSVEDIMQRFPTWFQTLRAALGEKTEDAIALIQERLVTLNDLPIECACFVKDPNAFSAKGLKRLQGFDAVRIAQQLYDTIEAKGLGRLKDHIKIMAKSNGDGMGTYMQVLRMSVVGELAGPDLVPLCEIIEKDVTLKRLENFTKHLKSIV